MTRKMICLNFEMIRKGRGREGENTREGGGG